MHACVCVRVCVCGIRVIRRILYVYNWGHILKSFIYCGKEFRLYTVVSGKTIKKSKCRDMFHVCDKKDVIGSVEDRLEE